MIVSLIGLPGSGKSTVGRNLSKRLKLPFIDSDHEIESKIGTSIRQFFEIEGEERFRDLEESVIDDITRHHHGVLSTGGGAVLRTSNRDHLRSRSHVIYLKSSPEDLYRRLRHDQNRPLLQVANPMARLRELFEQRDPLYGELAHLTVETGRPTVAMLVNKIVMQLELTGIISP